MGQNSLIVEVVGLPGVGKTTLSRLLGQCNKVSIKETPDFHQVKYAPFFAWNTLLSLRDLASIKSTGGHRQLSPRDMALLVILKGWYLNLERQRAKSSKIILLDEGPICYLTRLYAFGSNALKNGGAKPWWDATCQQWAKTLNLVIKLDTEDPILIDRIRSRDMPQIVKEISTEEALQYMKNHRTAQEYALNKIMCQAVSPQMIEFSTTQKSPEEIFTDLVKRLGL